MELETIRQHGDILIHTVSVETDGIRTESIFGHAVFFIEASRPLLTTEDRCLEAIARIHADGYRLLFYVIHSTDAHTLDIWGSEGVLFDTHPARQFNIFQRRIGGVMYRFVTGRFLLDIEVGRQAILVN
ncbi:MAG: hypothetical protein ABIE03_02330 [Patescibacteria group bacterium]|nr:hypothetical protein [Patescibacteria group bacterium]